MVTFLFSISSFPKILHVLRMSSNSEAGIQHTFKWKIENFRLCDKKNGECFKSPVFKVKSLSNTSWYISLYPRGHKKSKEGYMGCFLNSCIKDRSYKIGCDFKISVMSVGGKTLQSNKTSYVFTEGDFFGWTDFWKNSIQYNTSDILLIRCILKTKGKVSVFSESSGSTSFEYNHRSVKFIMRDLNYNCSNNYFIQYTLRSKLEIFVNVFNDDIIIRLCRGEKDFQAKSMMCQVSLLDVDNIQRISRQDLHFFNTGDPSIENDFWEFPTFLMKSKLNSDKEKYLEDDCFTLLFKIDFSNGLQTNAVEDKEYDSSAVDLFYPDLGTRTVLEDYKRLYKEKIHADVKLRVEDQIIQAHKSILSLRSPVFLAMFDTDMTENEEGSVDISDLEVETVSSLLEYMYSGSVENLHYKMALKLIVAADKYQVLSLKEKCSRFLESHLSVENVCDVLVVADLLQLQVLKDVTISYIKDNFECVFLSDEWKRAVENNLQLATETVINVSKLMVTNRNKPEKNVF